MPWPATRSGRSPARVVPPNVTVPRVGVLARRDGDAVESLKSLGWQIVGNLSSWPSRSGLMYPSHYRRAILD